MRNLKRLLPCWMGSALTLTALGVRAEVPAANDLPDSANSKAADAPSEQDLAEIADDAYIYAYSLMLMDATARLSTNVASPDNQHAPINQFARSESLPDATSTAVMLPN